VNFLAHLLLAGPGDEARVGALLGDFAGPVRRGDYGQVVAREIRIHRAIDSYTDAHPVVREAKARFRPQTRRFAGIVLDVFYDHALSARWDRYSTQPREEFIARAYAGLAAHAGPVPVRFARVLPWMIEQDWLGSYASFDGVALAVDRISTRLSKGADALRAGVEDARVHREGLMAGFDEFFPQLQAHVEGLRGAG
jgi:acyl carrier protein phosphodiesterase